MRRKRCSLFVLFIAILFKAHVCGKLPISTVILPCIIDPTYNSDSNRQHEIDSSTVIIEGRRKVNTLGIGIDLRWSLEAGKHVIRDGKSRQIDREYLTGKKWNVKASYTILSNTLIWTLCVRLTVFNGATWSRANGAHKRRHLISDLLRLESD